jgi:hypothetical protein
MTSKPIVTIQKQQFNVSHTTAKVGQLQKDLLTANDNIEN